MGTVILRRWCRNRGQSTGFACHTLIRPPVSPHSLEVVKTATGRSLPPGQSAPYGDVIAKGHLILETEFETDSGSVTLTDFMTPRDEKPELVRLLVGTRGQVQMNLELIIRFDYGSVVPWVRRTGTGISAIAGPDMLSLRTEVPLRGENFKTVAAFTVTEGQKISFDLTWYPSHQHEPRATRC